jgi:hypothetical protein
MGDEPRSRRATGRQKGGAASALAQLAELRRTKAKHASVYEIKEEDKLYDVVDEDEYADMVARRVEEGGKTSSVSIPCLDSLRTTGLSHPVGQM